MRESIVRSEYSWSETPRIHVYIYIYVYTHKGWDRWRKRTRALRNTRLAFCRAASAFIKESLAPSLSSGILLSSTSFSSCPSSPSFFLLVLFLLLFLFFLFVHVLLSSSERTNERTNIGAPLFRFIFTLLAVVPRFFPPL